MIKNRHIYILFLLQLLNSCTRDRAEILCVSPDTVSFSHHIQPIFAKYCNESGCHSGNSPAGNLDLGQLSAYAELTNSKSGYIDTINPKFSLLYAQMNSTSNPMPPKGKLDKCTLELILKWIQQKAKNN